MSMLDRVRSGGVYRDAGGDLREDTGRATLEGKYHDLKTQLLQRNDVKSSKQLKVARVERFLDEVFAYCKASKDLSQETERLHILKTLLGMMEGVLTGAAPYSVDNLERTVRIMCDKSRFAYLPVIQEFPINNQQSLNHLSNMVGDCEVDPEVFKALIKYAREEPEKLALANAWSDLFRKERLKLAGMPVFAETHDDKWGISPRRVIPTALPRYIDTKKFQAFDATMTQVSESVVVSETSTQNPPVCVLKVLESLRDPQHRMRYNNNSWEEARKAEKKYEVAHIDELWKYCLELLQNPGTSEKYGVTILRQLWLGSGKDPQRLVSLHKKVEQLSRLGAGHCKAVLAYITANTYGLTSQEVDALLDNAEALEAAGMAVIENLRPHCKSKQLLSYTQKLDPPEIARWHEYVSVISAMPKSTGETETDKKPILAKITSSFEDVQYGADYCKISPECLAYMAENVENEADADTMRVVACVYRNFSSRDSLDAFVHKIRALPVNARKALEELWHADFVQAGTVNVRVMNTMLAVAEKCGASGLKLMKGNKGWWEKHNPTGPKFDIETSELDLLEQTLLGSGKDENSHVANIQRLADEYFYDGPSPAWLANYVDALEHGGDAIVRMHKDNRHYRSKVGLSADEEWKLLQKRFAESDEARAYLRRLSTKPYGRAFPDDISPSDASVVYTDFVEGQAYSAHEEILPTVLAYAKSLSAKAEQAWRAENDIYQALLKEQNPGGLRGLVRNMVGKVFQQGADEQKPIARKMSEFVLHELHTFAAKLSDKIATIDEKETKTAVCKRMASVAHDCEEDSELFEYFLSIADQDIFPAMVQSMRSLWQGNNEQRKRASEAFTKYPALRGSDIVHEGVEIFEEMYAMCEKENGTKVYEWLTKGDALAPCNRMVGSCDITAYKLGITQLVDTYTRLSQTNGFEANDERPFYPTLLEVPTVFADVHLKDYQRGRLGPGDVNKVILWLEEKPERWRYLLRLEHSFGKNKAKVTELAYNLMKEESQAAEKNPNWLDGALIRLEIEAQHRSNAARMMRASE